MPQKRPTSPSQPGIRQNLPNRNVNKALHRVFNSTPLSDNGNMKIFAALLLLLQCSLGIAASEPGNPALAAVEAYVLQQTQGHSGKVSVSAGPLDPRMRLPHCTSYQAYTPSGAKLLGNATVGLRCLAPSKWNIFVPVRITVESTYVATAAPLAAGKTLQYGDLIVLTGDLGSLPSGTLTDPVQAVGKTLKYSLSSGQALRQDQLSAPLVVQSGQSVTLIFNGQGFTATNEGRALNSGSEGQLIQVRTQSGLVVSGVAQANGTVQVGNNSP